MSRQEELLLQNPQQLVGTALPRVDTALKVTGRLVYTRDMKESNMLYAKVKRCPYPHAKILKVNISKAMQKPGVRAALTANDFPEPLNEDTPPLARVEVLYANQAVAAVAADTIELAEDALDAIEVEYEELPYVVDPEVAMSEKTPVRITHPGEKTMQTNVGKHLKVRVGDVDAAFSRAAIVVENTYSTQMESHFQLEPLSFLASPDADGGVTLWATSHGAHLTQYEVAACLGMDKYKVRVKVQLLGGWFGSKEESHLAAVCSKLALKALKPVKLDLTREETMTATGVRHPSRIRVKDGLTRDAKILCREIVAIYNGGAYGSLGNALLKKGLLAASAVYVVPNLKIDSYRVYTNEVPGTPKRAPMGYQMVWAVECQMEQDAAALGIDPVEFRLRNLVQEGGRNAIGEKMESISHERCLLAVAKAIDYRKKRPGQGSWRYGKGVALAAKWTAGGPHQATVRVRENGKVEVWADAVENGQGIYTGLTQLAADEFGIGAEDVILHPLVYGADSASSGYSEGASASRQLVNIGKALMQACQDAKRRVAEQASQLLDEPPAKIRVSGGKAFVEGSRKSIPISDLFRLASKLGYKTGAMISERGEIVGYGTFNKTESEMDPETGKVLGERVSPHYASVAQGVELAVNVETGSLRVLKIAAAHDVGKAINPALVRGQIIGSVIMGLSAALTEELVVEGGRITNSNLADYKLLTSVDAPVVEPIVIENPYRDGPHGAKSAGEPSILPTAAATRNAIHDAVGVWVNDLPMTPEKILDAIYRGAANA